MTQGHARLHSANTQTRATLTGSTGQGKRIAGHGPEVVIAVPAVPSDAATGTGRSGGVGGAGKGVRIGLGDELAAAGTVRGAVGSGGGVAGRRGIQRVGWEKAGKGEEWLCLRDWGWNWCPLIKKRSRKGGSILEAAVAEHSGYSG
ncbi:MAG: hypothetical protein Q9160_008053 [Pyrenula sp. 1 TL-2023]